MAAIMPQGGDTPTRALRAVSAAAHDPNFRAVVPLPRTTPLEELRDITARSQAIAQTAWNSEPPEHIKEAILALEQINRSVAALRTELLTALERSGSWQSDGDRTIQSWMSNHTGVSRNTATKEVRLSKTLSEDLPQTKEALAHGTISEDHAQILARECTKSANLREKLKDPDSGEAALLEQAQHMNATEFLKTTKAWAIKHDPQGADQEWRKESEKEELVLSTSARGCRISGWLGPANGALLVEALASHMGRRASGDTRGFAERQAAGLVAMAHQSLNSGLQLPGARIRPQLTITMEYETLSRLVHATAPSMPASIAASNGSEGINSDRTDSVSAPPVDPEVAEAAWAAAWQPGDDHVIGARLDYRALQGANPALLPDGTPISHGELARFACSSALSRVIFGPESTVLDSGREERIFTASQTRAIIARDQHCQFPGCYDSPNRCEVHHSLEWFKHRGDTHVDLGVLLCWHHHSLVHQQQITIERSRGSWFFRRKDGTKIGPPRGAPPENNQPLLSEHSPPKDCKPNHGTLPLGQTPQSALFSEAELSPVVDPRGGQDSRSAPGNSGPPR